MILQSITCFYDIYPISFFLGWLVCSLRPISFLPSQLSTMTIICMIVIHRQRWRWTKRFFTIEGKYLKWYQSVTSSRCNGCIDLRTGTCDYYACICLLPIRWCSPSSITISFYLYIVFRWYQSILMINASSIKTSYVIHSLY